MTAAPTGQPTPPAPPPPFELARRASPLAGPGKGACPEGNWARDPPMAAQSAARAYFQAVPAEKGARRAGRYPIAAGGED